MNKSDVSPKGPWERALPVLQAVLLIPAGLWAAFTYYVDRRDKLVQPASITVQPRLESIGRRDGQQFVKATISVNNSGAKTYVVNSPFTITASRLDRATDSGRNIGTAEAPLWNASSEIEAARYTVMSGEAFRRGFWFEPGEQSSRSFIIAIPDELYQLVTIKAGVRHAKVLDDTIATKWTQGPDHSFAAETLVTVDNKPVAYNGLLHAAIREQKSIAYNDGESALTLWPQVLAIATH